MRQQASPAPLTNPFRFSRDEATPSNNSQLARDSQDSQDSHISTCFTARNKSDATYFQTMPIMALIRSLHPGFLAFDGGSGVSFWPCAGCAMHLLPARTLSPRAASHTRAQGQNPIQNCPFTLKQGVWKEKAPTTQHTVTVWAGWCWLAAHSFHVREPWNPILSHSLHAATLPSHPRECVFLRA